MEHPISIYNTTHKKKRNSSSHCTNRMCTPPPLRTFAVLRFTVTPTWATHGRLSLSDLLFRYLTHIGYKVRYVRNINGCRPPRNMMLTMVKTRLTKKARSRTTRADGSGAVLPEPLPSRYGSAQRSTAQHRTACVRPYHRADRTGKENTG